MCTGSIPALASNMVNGLDDFRVLLFAKGQYKVLSCIRIPFVQVCLDGYNGRNTCLRTNRWIIAGHCSNR